MEPLKTTIITLTCKTDSDKEFWADNSSDSEYDEEISEWDQWKCDKCGSFNKPPMRYCLKCWDERNGWLPERRSERRLPPKRKKTSFNHKLSFKEKDGSNNVVESTTDFAESKINSSQSSSITTSSQETLIENELNSKDSNPSSSHQGASTSSYNPSTSHKETKLCMLCLTKPANASIIHGKIAHQISCYRCARKLQSKKKSCPICRRTIDRVVHQITVEWQ